MTSKRYRNTTAALALFFVLFFFSYAAIGAVWTTGGPDGGPVSTLAMTTNPDVMYAGTDKGIFKTVNGGDTWNKTNFPEIPVRVVRVAPENPEPAINFDDISAPCSFEETTALTDEYSTLGVVFSGPGGNNGGAIINECIGGSIVGHSSPNFLSFDTNASLSDGGIPTGPETITFNSPVTYVRINAGSIDWTIVRMDAYDALNNIIDADALYVTSAVKSMSVSGTGITRVVITFLVGTTLVLDDLAFIEQPVGQQLDVVYAGTDDGIYKSGDGGISWIQKNGQYGELSGARVNIIDMDPLNPDTLYAGTGWPDSNASEEIVGIFKSTDGGETWDEKLSGDGIDAVATLLVDANNSLYIYAGVYPQTAAPWYEKDGIRISSDGGENWVSKKVNPDVSTSDKVVALAMTPYGLQPEAIYAVNPVRNPQTRYVYKSTDKGESWTPTNSPAISSSSPWSLAVDPNQSNIVVYVGTDDELYKSPDGGDTWSIETNGLPASPSTIVIDPRVNLLDPQPSVVYVGLSGGIYKSTDEAESWILSCQGINLTYIKDLAVDPASSDSAFAAIKGEFHLAATSNGGALWDYLFNSPTDLGAVAVDPQVPSTIFAGEGMKWQKSIYVYKSTNRGQIWTGTKLFSLLVSTDLGVSDIWIDPDNSDTILVAVRGETDGAGLFGGGVYRSSNQGETWYKVDYSLYSYSVTSLASDPANPQIVYFGTTGYGNVFQSNVGGVAGSWTKISPDGLWVGGVRDIEVDLNTRVYAATNEGVMKWNGSSWTKLTDLPTDNVNALAVDRSTSPGTVYAGTGEYGVFVSRDGGSNWTSFNEGLNNLYITKLAISESQPRILYAGTAYGGAWSRIIEEVLMGDINEDGVIDISDVILVLRIALGLDQDPGCSDINNDSNVDISDVILTLRMALGLDPLQNC